MTWPIHTLFGISTLWLLAPLPPEILQANWGVLAVAAAFGALLPDLDASESKIKYLKIPNTQIKPFLLPALIVSRSDQHRGLLHSLTGLGMIALLYSGDVVGRMGACDRFISGIRQPFGGRCCHQKWDSAALSRLKAFSLAPAFVEVYDGVNGGRSVDGSHGGQRAHLANQPHGLISHMAG